MSKDRYIAFAHQEAGLPIFMQPWWLDTVSMRYPWDAITVLDSSGQVVGAWAFQTRKLSGLNAVTLPPMTPFTGIWLKIDETLPMHKQEVQRQDILADLEKQLPRVAILELKVQWPLQDWMPFYWAGYRQETRYTFRFDAPDEHNILANVSKSFRRNYRSAERRFTVRRSTDPGELRDLVSRVFEIRGDDAPFPTGLVERVCATVLERGCGTIYCAEEPERGVRSAILTVWDNDTTYYLLGGRAGSNTQNANNLLLMHAISDAQKRGHAFDFEGSMIKGVHRFFQSFGARMQPYMLIYRYRGPGKLKLLA